MTAKRAHLRPCDPETARRHPNEVIGILTGQGEVTQFRPAKVQALDTEHDLALLRLVGAPLPALALGDAATVREGQAMAFTGFPLGTLLGLRHVTHRATVSSLTPVVMPSENAQRLDVRRLAQLQKAPYTVFSWTRRRIRAAGSPCSIPDRSRLRHRQHGVRQGPQRGSHQRASGTLTDSRQPHDAILLKNK